MNTSTPKVPEGMFVFLGGACGASTWRDDVAIPALEAAGKSYFNPQMAEGAWTEACIEPETIAKEQAAVLLFVVDGSTRGCASLTEAQELICERPDVLVLVIEDIEDGTVVGDQVVTGGELSDLTRGRKYVRKSAERHNVPLYSSLDDAMAAVIEKLEA